LGGISWSGEMQRGIVYPRGGRHKRILSWRHTGFNVHSRVTSHIPDKGQVIVRYYSL